MARRDSGLIGSNLRLAIGLLALIAAVLLAGQWIWLRLFLMNAETTVSRLARVIGPTISSGQPAEERIYRNFIAREPEVAYVVVADFRTGYRRGITSEAALRNSGSGLEDHLRRHGTDATLESMIRPGAGFAGEYLHVVSAAFVPEAGVNDRTPLGVLKVGFVVPGYVRGLPGFGRAYGKVVRVWAVVTVLLCASLLIVGLRKSSERSTDFLPPVLSREGEAKNDLAWLEQDLEREETYFVDHEGVSWKVLFGGTDLDAWNLKGQVYLSDGEMVLRPWGSSAVCQTGPTDRDYFFRLFARKIAGPDGFVILFPCDSRAVTWVIGGWGNRRAELAGNPGTARECTIEKSRWYQIDIRVGPDSAEGFVDDVSFWKVPRSEIRSSPVDAGLQTGLGVASWNTLARFRDIRYRAL